MRISRVIPLAFLVLTLPALASLVPAIVVPGGKSQPLIGDIDADGPPSARPKATRSSSRMKTAA